jgi:CoA:oxalate CoA-transferase
MGAKGPLAGLFVLDLSRVLAGPYCTLVLADLGARVVKVEAPGRGDDARQIGPFVGGVSAYFLSLNRGKESIALDLRAEGDRAIFGALLARADVLVENFRPGVMERLGLGFAALHARFPRLVVASTSGFGQTGPYARRPAYDVVVQGMGGIMSLTGHPGGPPTRVGTSTGDITAGLFSAIGVLAALVERARTGQGRHVDVAMLDCQVATLENAIARYVATGVVPGPIGSRHPSVTPFQAFATRDGFVIVAAGNDGLFAKLCAALGRPAFAHDARFRTNDERTRNVEALTAELESAFAARASSEWLAALEAAGIPCGPLNDVAAVLADPQVRARNMVVRVEDPDAGAFSVAGNPVKLSGVGDPPTRPPAPRLDEHRAAILAELAAGDGS